MPLRPSRGRWAALSARVQALTAVSVCWSVGLVACAPALNWRNVHPADAQGLQATFPCKPMAAQRRLVLPGLPDPVTLNLLSCEADGSMWALTHLTLSDATQVPTALRALAASTRGNVELASREAQREGRGDAVGLATGSAQPMRATELSPVSVPRMTPQSESRAWRFEGLRPSDGGGAVVPLSVTAWHFSNGLTVFQASVWQAGEAAGAHSGREGVITFLQGFRFPG